MSASVKYKDKRKGKDVALQDAQHGFVESRREEVRLQYLSMKKGFSEILKSEICTKWKK